jgi:hypothetical protein
MTTIHAYTSSQSIVASGNRIIAGAGLPRTRVGESETAVTHHTEESR